MKRYMFIIAAILLSSLIGVKTVRAENDSESEMFANVLVKAKELYNENPISVQEALESETNQASKEYIVIMENGIVYKSVFTITYNPGPISKAKQRNMRSGVSYNGYKYLDIFDSVTVEWNLNQVAGPFQLGGFTWDTTIGRDLGGNIYGISTSITPIPAQFNTIGTSTVYFLEQTSPFYVYVQGYYTELIANISPVNIYLSGTFTHSVYLQFYLDAYY